MGGWPPCTPDPRRAPLICYRAKKLILRKCQKVKSLVYMDFPACNTGGTRGQAPGVSARRPMSQASATTS